MHYGDPNENVPPFSLAIVSGGESGQRFVFAQPEVTLGRIADNDLVLYDAAVSRRHLVFYYRNQQFILEDLGSSNGSLLNGIPVTQPTVLCDQDILDVGSVRFQFSSENINEYDDAEDPTEIEQDVLVSDIPEINALVRSRYEVQENQAQPPIGDTRQFPAHALSDPPRQFESPSFTQMPASSVPLVQPRAEALASANPPHNPPPTGIIRPPDMASMVASAQAAQAASHQRPEGFQNAQSHTGAIQPPVQLPQPSGFAHPAPPASTPSHLAGHRQAKPHKNKHLHWTERNRAKKASIWSFLFLLGAVALFVIPAKPRPKTKVHSQQDEAILLNDDIYPKVFGYNKRDSLHTHKVRFQFLYKNGNVQLSYRASASDSIQVLVNGHTWHQFKPEEKQWHYDRRFVPRKWLRAYRYNRIEFRRVTLDDKPVLWGLTNIKLEEKPFPPPDLKKAKLFCAQGRTFYDERQKKPAHRYQAWQQYQLCHTHLTLLKQRPLLYKTASIMLSQIHQELDLLYHQQLKKAQQATQSKQRSQIYQKLIQFFPNKNDPRHQKIEQLQQSQ